MDYNDVVATEIAEELWQEKLVIVIDTLHGHRGRTKLVAEKIGKMATGVACTATMLSGDGIGTLRLLSTNPRSLEGVRFNVAYVNATALPPGKSGDRAVKTLHRCAVKMRDGGEVRYF